MEDWVREDVFLNVWREPSLGRNALEHALAYGLRYVEGIAFEMITGGYRRGHWIPTLQAWNADESGTLVDTTTGNGGLAYFGVEFSVDRAYDAWASCDPGSNSVLWDEQRRWPILLNLWPGEDHEHRFSRSAALDNLRGKPLQYVKQELDKQSQQLSMDHRQK